MIAFIAVPNAPSPRRAHVEYKGRRPKTARIAASLSISPALGGGAAAARRCAAVVGGGGVGGLTAAVVGGGAGRSLVTSPSDLRALILWLKRRRGARGALFVYRGV